MEFQSKTLHYLKVKKPQLERQRRARINKCLDALKTLIVQLQGNDAVLRMDKADLLEATIILLRAHKAQFQSQGHKQLTAPATDCYRNGYMNAVNEVSRVMAATPGMNIALGKTIMTHLGRCYKQLQEQPGRVQWQQLQGSAHTVDCGPLSPASSGYHSDYDSNATTPTAAYSHIWRPW